jgi:hypothetical protein
MPESTFLRMRSDIKSVEKITVETYNREEEERYRNKSKKEPCKSHHCEEAG